jgi:hypothetical protein
MKMEIDPVSETLCFLVCGIPEDEHSSKTQQFLKTKLVPFVVRSEMRNVLVRLNTGSWVRIPLEA